MSLKSYKDDTISHTTARDMSLLSNHILNAHPDVLKLQNLKISSQIKNYIIPTHHYLMKQMV